MEVRYEGREGAGLCSWLLVSRREVLGALGVGRLGGKECDRGFGAVLFHNVVTREHISYLTCTCSIMYGPDLLHNVLRSTCLTTKILKRPSLCPIILQPGINSDKQRQIFPVNKTLCSFKDNMTQHSHKAFIKSRIATLFKILNI